ncbi:PilN family type IVB pilus formation outer membrane protein, partial [Burkholderia sp. WAC0059]|uniref:PilN family type IVB pilus formation outer membrane protein n=1 Tax=Burkholderia sp. WAC0059 TaxID=2066022 RepID=UPI000C7F51CD
AYAGTTPVQISYRSGDLSGLLDLAGTRFGVFWKYTDGRILFYYTDTRVFQVNAVPGAASLDANVVSAASSNSSSGNGTGSGSGGGGVGGGGVGGGGIGGGAGVGSSSSSGNNSTPSVSSDNTASTDMNSQLSVFDSLQSAIKSMLSPYGSVVSSPATGSLSVTDTPDVLDRVAAFMDQENQVMSRQILVDVTVLTVTLSASDNYGINWGAVYQALGTQFGISNTFPTTALNPVSFSAAVISPSSRADTTTAMITALSEQGTVRRKTSAAVTTLNNQPVPVEVATQQGYLAEVSTTNTANVGSQTSLTPGTITTGFNLTLLPHVLDDGTVMMQFYSNLSVLDQLQQVSSGGQQIQVPEVDTRNFLQRVAVKSGQTLVISGYEGINDSGTQQGVGSASNPVFGGGYNASRSREVIVILVTPVLMSDS